MNKLVTYFRHINFEQAFIYYNIIGIFCLHFVLSIAFSVFLDGAGIDVRSVTFPIVMICGVAALALLWLSLKRTVVFSQKSAKYVAGVYTFICVMTFFLASSVSPIGHTGWRGGVELTYIINKFLL